MPTYHPSLLLWSSLLLLTIQGLAQPLPPSGLQATGYDHHIELSWAISSEPFLEGYRIYGGPDSASATFIGFVPQQTGRFVDFLGAWDESRTYYIRSINASGNLGAATASVSATTREMNDEELLDMVQEYTFRYFWEFGHPVSGMARERNTTSIVTSGGSGFGIMAIIVGAERGFITYEQALERTTKIVDFLERADRFQGVWAHWMNGTTGEVIPFSRLDDGGDLVETAFLLEGLLTARQYYGGDTPEEQALRDKITELWEAVDWNWYRNQGGNVLLWHWSPNNAFDINLRIQGFNETHIIYLLGVAAPLPEHRIPAFLYDTGWAGGNYTNGQRFYDITLEVGSFRGGPLFFSHYSYLGWDVRNVRDQYTNYFERNTAHTLINRAHCIANPYNRTGYSADNWGITASDDPIVGYLAHSPANMNLDNGTIAPTAALSSMPYTPEFSMDALRYFYRVQGQRLWGIYGFYDAFNLDRNWFADSYLAIDQGPIICMIENFRSGLLWRHFMANPEIAPALEAIGFVPDSTTNVADPAAVERQFDVLPTAFPNPPTNTQLQLTFALKNSQRLELQLIDMQGRTLQILNPNQNYRAGEHQLPIHLPALPAGRYGLLMKTEAGPYVLPLTIP